jgi:hypothetical protein
MREWQPIETAPKDESVLGYLPGWGIEIGAINSDDEDDVYWVDNPEDGFLYPGEPFFPTHWMPLPSPPAPSSTSHP